MEELKKAIAFLFRKKGRDAMTETDFVMSASMDLRWFLPKEAQRLLQICVDAKLLAMTDGKLTPSFDVASVDVPLDYAPQPSLLDTRVGAADLFLKILDRILSVSRLEKKQAISMVNTTQGELDVEVEVAALVVARNLGVDVSDLLDEVEGRVVSRLG